MTAYRTPLDWLLIVLATLALLGCGLWLLWIGGGLVSAPMTERDEIEDVQLHPADLAFVLGCAGLLLLVWVFAAIGVIVTIGRLT